MPERKMKRYLVPLMLVACSTRGGAGPSAPPGVAMASITVTSKSLASSGMIPVDYSCDGKDASPQLTWSSPPKGTRSIAIIVDDPDAPGGTFTHWIVLGLPPETTTLAEAVDPASLGATSGSNDFHNARYNGPCPPKGEMHRYEFHVLALDAPLSAREGTNREELDALLGGHVLGHGRLTGVFSH
jgi:Raf kinase inhibitor-like YbhB/YbcL family protein